MKTSIEEKRLFILKKAFFLLLLILTFSTSQVFAHTGLEESVPKEGEVVTEKLNQLTLTFETKIENGSTVELLNQSNETFKPDQVTINENQLQGQFQLLTNGEYTVNWKIIGADGHIVEGQYSFSLQATEPDVPIEEETEEGMKEETTEKQADDQKQEETETSNDEAVENRTSEQGDRRISPLTIGFGIVVVIILLVIIGRLLKRSK